MNRKNLTFKQLIEQNKEELKNNQKAIERIEKKLDLRYISIKH
ncbi:FbpB family small basic protein [Niallia sp. XMNu-256]